MGRSAGQDGSPKGKRVAEGEMVRWHHRLSGHAFEQTPREWGTGERPGLHATVRPLRPQCILPKKGPAFPSAANTALPSRRYLAGL